LLTDTSVMLIDVPTASVEPRAADGHAIREGLRDAFTHDVEMPVIRRLCAGTIA